MVTGYSAEQSGFIAWLVRSGLVGLLLSCRGPEVFITAEGVVVVVMMMTIVMMMTMAMMMMIMMMMMTMMIMMLVSYYSV